MNEEWWEPLAGWLVDKVLLPIVVLFLILCVLSIPFGIYAFIKDCNSPTFDLKKDEWTCTKTYIYYTYLKGVRYEHEACSTYVKTGGP